MNVIKIKNKTFVLAVIILVIISLLLLNYLIHEQAKYTRIFVDAKIDSITNPIIDLKISIEGLKNAKFDSLTFDLTKKISQKNFSLYYDSNNNNLYDNSDKKIAIFSNDDKKLKIKNIDFVLKAHGNPTKPGSPNKYSFVRYNYQFFIVMNNLNKNFIKNIDFESFDIGFKNILNKKIKPDVRFSYADTFQYFENINFDQNQFLQAYPFFKLGDNDQSIILTKDIYTITENIIIPKKLTLTIEPGTTLQFNQNISLISYGKIISDGTEDFPIIYTSQNQPWGVLGLIETNSSGSSFKFSEFSNGSETYINGIYFSGMLASHYSETLVENCTFKNANADDALNFKYSNSKIINSKFIENNADAIDFDYMAGEIINNYFINNGNDSIDTSGSTTFIKNNFITKSGDKCMSFGEKSSPVVINNIMDSCNIGIEVKDSSEPVVINNVITNNNIGINSYQKKPYFEGGHGNFYNDLLATNKQDITFINTFTGKLSDTDNSTINITYSNIPSGYSGENNKNIQIDYNELTDFNWQVDSLQNQGNYQILKQHYPDFSDNSVPIGIIETVKNFESTN